MKSNKKYILKPGKHQFVPGSAAIHHNDNLSDKEAEWYMQRYPHIKTLFINLKNRVEDQPTDEQKAAVNEHEPSPINSKPE